MKSLVDITNHRFGRLLVVGRSAVKSTSGAMWNCICDCGEKRVVASLKLRDGRIVSCGCMKKDRKPTVTHGMSNKSTTYRTWKEMRQRCNNPNSTQYQWYGGRGIHICERWDDFTVFLSDMGERPVGCTIDRIDPDGNYEPGNCRWATSKEQATTNRGTIKPGSIPKNKLPDEIWQKAFDLRESGVSLRNVASMLGVSYTHCSTKINELLKVNGRS